MKFGLQGKVALVTGGSRGIGRAIAVTLAEQGVNIALCGRTQETLTEAAEEIRALGVQAWPIVRTSANWKAYRHSSARRRPRPAGRIS